jgi:hypothetical protein
MNQKQDTSFRSIHELHGQQQGNARFFAKTGQWNIQEKSKYLLYLLQHLEDIK